MTRLTESAHGVFIIGATPFHEDGALDLPATAGLMDFYLGHGVSGVAILGIMGEAPKLTVAEAVSFSRHVVRRVRGRVPVVVGTSARGFASMAELARAVMDDGAAGVMIAPHASLRTDDAILAYFQQVAEALGEIPWVLQDYPQASGVQISPALMQRLIATVPTFVALKHEDWPGLAKISSIRDAEAEGLRRIAILVGNGAAFLPEELRRGADGAMSGFAFPEMMVAVLAAHRVGDFHRAADLFDAYLPLVRYEQQPGVGLAVRKYLLARRGAIPCAAQRRPHTTLGPREIAEVEFLLARQERRLRELGA